MKKNIILLILVILLFQLEAQIKLPENTQAMIKVSIVGVLSNPGIFELAPGSRLSEALAQIDLIEYREKEVKSDDPIDETKVVIMPRQLFSTRHLELTRGSQVQQIDLQQYYSLGDISANPQLVDGDIIKLFPLEENLGISGAIMSKGNYEYRPGDRVSDLIKLAHGLSELARRDSATLIRLDYNTGEIQDFSFSPAEVLENENSLTNFELESGDRIFIRYLPEYNSKFQVRISGEVVYPGSYAIEPGKTSLYDVFQQAGGSTEEADLSLAYLQRDFDDIHPDQEYLRLELQELSDLTTMEKEYLKFKNRTLAGVILRDFSDLEMKGNIAKRTYLQHNDLIHIPQKSMTVEVMGAVYFPGVYQWKEGKTIDYYINLAGGYTDLAHKSKLSIILAGSGTWLKRDEERALDRGDKIFIPEKKRYEFWDVFKETITVMSQFATVVIAVINIYSN